ncbi:hypothetical protein FN846DRAFT_901860 [Sphaerosporella brunnea]|uniref:Uncharacterized protein n=1 Tax=Sphaerosporella brunnea TaxID=1250544 RepID=A0A5J5FB97_9PEZI|nr:hypothetical protein FN846DRAFT_901860 [Sphaerosporella brunnea]
MVRRRNIYDYPRVRRSQTTTTPPTNKAHPDELQKYWYTDHKGSTAPTTSSMERMVTTSSLADPVFPTVTTFQPILTTMLTTALTTTNPATTQSKLTTTKVPTTNQGSSLLTKSSSSDEKGITFRPALPRNANEPRWAEPDVGGIVTTIRTLTTILDNGKIMTHVVEYTITIPPISPTVSTDTTTTITTTLKPTGTGDKGSDGGATPDGFQIKSGVGVGLAIGVTALLALFVVMLWQLIRLSRKRARDKAAAAAAAAAAAGQVSGAEFEMMPQPKVPPKRYQSPNDPPDVEAYPSREYSEYATSGSSTLKASSDTAIAPVVPHNYGRSGSGGNPGGPSFSAQRSPTPPEREPSSYNVDYVSPDREPRGPYLMPGWGAGRRPSGALDPYAPSPYPSSRADIPSSDAGWTDVPPEEYQQMRQRPDFQNPAVFPGSSEDLNWDPRPAPLNIVKRSASAQPEPMHPPGEGNDGDDSHSSITISSGSISIPETRSRERSRASSPKGSEDEDGRAMTSGSEHALGQERGGLGLRGRGRGAGAYDQDSARRDETEEANERWNQAKKLMEGRQL